MDKYFDLIALNLTSPEGILVICSLIIIWAIFTYISFRVKITPIIKGVENGIQDIIRFKNSEEFAKNFELVDKKIRGNNILKHAWSEFNETLIINPDLEPLAIRNTRTSDEYFYRDSIIGNRLNLRFYSALPNLFTGSGILGTFIGLVAGIWLASKGLGSSDVDTVRKSLEDLLSGASVAFLTSIFGLLSSLLFSWREKVWIHKLDGLVLKWSDDLDSRLDRVTNESVASQHLEQTKQQTEILTQFTSELAFQIADAFQEKMTTSLGPIMEKMLAAVEDLREDQGKKNDEALHEILNTFSESLSGSAGVELTALGETLGSLNNKLESQIDTLSLRQNEINEASSKSVNDLAKVVKWSVNQMQEGIGDSLNTVIEKIGSMVGDLSGEMKEAAREVAERLGNLNTRLSATMEEVQKIITSAADAAESYQIVLDDSKTISQQFNETAQSLEKIVSPIEEASTNLKLTAEEIGNATRRNETFSLKIGSTIGELKVIQEEIRNTWEGYESRFAQVDKSLESTIKELITGVDNYSTKVNDYVAGLDKHTSSIVTDLAGASNELSEAIEALTDTLSK